MIVVELFEAIIAYTALMVTLGGGIFAFLLYQFFPLKSKVERLHDDVYGNGREGLLDVAEDERESLSERVKEFEDVQMQTREDTRELLYYVKAQSTILNEELDRSIPVPDGDLNDSFMYRSGNRDRHRHNG